MFTEAMAKRIEIWPIEKLIPYARNPRTHSPEQVTQIAASIAEFGFVNPVLVDSDDGILAGHGRLLGAQKLKLREVPVIVLDHLTPAQRKAYLLADNKLAELAGWDEDLLRLELQDLELADFDLGVIGFSDEELRDLLGEPDVVTGLTDEDTAPEPPEQPVSRTGDIWLLGTDKHRVLCGDATNLDAVKRLMGGEHADLVFTDPPYNVDYEGYTDEKLKIQGDRMKPEEFDRFLRGAFASYRAVVKPGASLYVCHASSVQREFQNALEAGGFAVRCQIIWGKNTFAWGFGRYKFQHEPIFYCHITGQKDPWYGDKSQSTLWQEKKPAANRLHPTMKPVELIERALLNSSKGGDCVLDLFGGSGSTLIACERRNRNTRLMELDPKYTDVIVKRWQEYSGHSAILAGEDRSFDEVAAERMESA
jgi:DNA modification methylase